MKKVFLFALLIGLSYSGTAQQITYSKDIAPILYNNCTSCHHQGALAPFNLESYADAYGERIAINTSTAKRIMPPWPPDSKYSKFIHQRSLTDSQINVISQWVMNGAPEGDPKLAPPVPSFNDNAVLGVPDFTVTIPKYNVTSTTDDYRCFAMASNLNIDKFITGIEPLPGNHKIVHHILIYYDTTGACQKLDDADPLPGYAGFGGVGSNDAKLLGAWVPGSGPVQFPKGMGIKVYSKGTYVLQIHYAPGSNGQSDNTSIHFIYTNNVNLREVILSPILNHYSSMTNGPLDIPANKTRLYHEKFVVPSPYNFSLLSVAPHMHLIGQVMTVYAVLPNKDTVHLISIKNWDFHWQGSYTFLHPIHIPAGSALYADAFYDNTTTNPHNPNFPPKRVVVGESTTNEMMLCFFGFMFYNQGDENLDLDALTQLPKSSVNETAANNFGMKLYPNPAEGISNLVFNLGSSQMTNISIYDMDGRLIKEVLNTILVEGEHTVPLALKEINPGQYFCRITTNEGTQSQKLTVIR
jgi:hypothetical protein